MSLSFSAYLMPFFATAVAVCGTFLLQTAWGLRTRNWSLVLSAWTLIFGSFYLWGLTIAADKGVALGVTVWIVVVLIFLGIAAFKSDSRPERSAKKVNLKTTVSITRPQILRAVLTAIIMGPLAGLAAMTLSTLSLLIMQSLKVEYTANLAIATIFFPILWGGLAVTLGYQKKLSTRLVTVSSICIGSIICLWVAQ